MVRMVVDAKVPTDDFGNARCGPKVGAVSEPQRPAEQKLHETLLLCAAHLGWPPGRKTHLERLRTALRAGVPPAQYGARRTADATSDFMQGKTLIEKFQSAAAPVFEQYRRRWLALLGRERHAIAQQDQGTRSLSPARAS